MTCPQRSKTFQNVPKRSKTFQNGRHLYSPLTGEAIVTDEVYVTKMAVPAHVCLYWSV